MDGDYLLEIDGTKIPDVQTFLRLIETKRGQTITLLLSRRGTRLSKTIRTNP
jgi:C-terminal processing protease CtpA/Prc